MSNRPNMLPWLNWLGWRHPRWWFYLVPNKRAGGPYTWLERGSGRSPRLVWWMLIPKPLQRWWVYRYNRRYCARHGHDDMLWHMSQYDDIDCSPECSSCLAPLSACVGNDGRCFYPEPAGASPLPGTEGATHGN